MRVKDALPPGLAYLDEEEQVMSSAWRNIHWNSEELIAAPEVAVKRMPQAEQSYLEGSLSWRVD